MTQVESFQPRLVVMRGEEVFETYPLEVGREYQLGRHSRCDIVVAHPSVSRFHARIYTDTTGVYVEDLSSRNGTYVNGRRVRGPYLLRDGDVIRLGQVTEPHPIVLKLEDPSARLLDAVAEEPPPASVSGHFPKSVQVQWKATWEWLRANARHPVLWAGGLIVITVVLVTVGLVRWVQHRRTPWQAVRIEPPVARAGDRLVLRSEEIIPTDDLQVFIGGHSAPAVEVQPGQVVVQVPRLNTEGSTPKIVEIKVRQAGWVVFRQTVPYQGGPIVSSVYPIAVRPGQIVRLEGTGFPQLKASVRVRLGDYPMPVLDVTEHRIRARVPYISLERPAALPLRVEIDGWLTEAGKLRVQPQPPTCPPLNFSATYLRDGIWEIYHPFGCVLHVAGPKPSSPIPPAEVQAILERLADIARRARQDPDLRVHLREMRGTVQLMARDNSTRHPMVLTEWNRPMLKAVARLTGFSGEPFLIPVWYVYVFEDALALWAWAQPPSALPETSPLRGVLQTLYRANVEIGGPGCPTDVDLAVLSIRDRRLLRRGCRDMPPLLGSFSGTWVGPMDNVFYQAFRKAQVMLHLELKHRGLRVQGTAWVETHAPNMRWLTPRVKIQGRIRIARDPLLTFSLSLPRPFGWIKLTGGFRLTTLEGTFQTARGRRGRFALKRSHEKLPETEITAREP